MLLTLILVIKSFILILLFKDKFMSKLEKSVNQQQSFGLLQDNSGGEWCFLFPKLKLLKLEINQSTLRSLL